MLKKLVICVLALMLMTVAFGTAQAEGDLPELTLDELIQWKQSTEPEFLTEDMLNQVISGNLYEEYYGVTAAAVGDPLRAYATCDRSLFQVGLTSTVTTSVTGGSLPYRFNLMPFRRLPDDEDAFYWSFGVSSQTNTLSITPEDIYQYMIRFTITAPSGDYVTFYTVYETVTPASLSDAKTIGGKIRAVIASEIKPGMTDRQKALAIHDWLTHNAYYDNSLQNHGPDGVLLKGTGVCESYARAYQMFMSELGIPNVYISSDRMNHAWNMIYVDGGWYHVDVTWDDPTGGTNPVSGWESTNYFCMTDAAIARDHMWNDTGLSSPISGKGPVYLDPETEPAPMPDASLGNNSLTIQEGALSMLRFTATQDGIYSFETIGDKYTTGHLYDGKMNPIADKQHGGANGNFLLYRYLQKGQVVYIGVEYSESGESGNETLVIKYGKNASIGDNTVAMEAGRITIVGFVAPENGVYSFETIGSNDTVGHLFDSEMEEITRDDDGGKDSNFLITANLTKDQMVFISVQYYDYDVTSKTETLRISVKGSPEASTDTLLTLTGRPFSPLNGKPTLLFFAKVGCGNSSSMLRQLAGYDLTAMNVVIVEGCGYTLSEAKQYFASNASGITGATMGYDAEYYMWDMLEIMDPDIERITTPAVFYVSADNKILDYTTGFDSDVIGHVRSILGVSLIRNNFSGARLVLPASTTTIGSEAFRGTAAQLIEIPAGCTSVAADAFAGCSNLKIILNHSDLTITPPAGVVVTDIPAG